MCLGGKFVMRSAKAFHLSSAVFWINVAVALEIIHYVDIYIQLSRCGIGCKNFSVIRVNNESFLVRDGLNLCSVYK